MPEPTTRYARYIYRILLYQKRYLLWRHHSDIYVPISPTRWIRVGKKWNHGRGPKLEHPIKGNVGPPYYFVNLPTSIQFTLFSAADYKKPPHYKYVHFQYRAQYTNTHRNAAYRFVGYFWRSVRTCKKRPRDKRNTPFNRQITGCNWQYFKNGYFPDDDPLGRRPNSTDANNGVPPGDTLWPVPLGYQNP